MPAARRHQKPPGRRTALRLLADRGPAGLAATVLIDRGYTVRDLLELINDGLAKPHLERVVDGRRQLDLSRLYLTEAGREALAKAMA